MKHTKEMLLIKVEDLVPSPYNVRRYSAGQVEELAALIASQGLLQNLIVTEQGIRDGVRQVLLPLCTPRAKAFAPAWPQNALAVR